MMVTPPSSSISMNESPLFSASMDPTLLAMATAAEHVDSSNWLDDFAAAPTPIQAALGLKWEWNPLQPTSVAMVASHIPFFHFNVASTLGIDSDQVDEPLLDSIKAFFGPDKTHHITVAERFLDDTNKAVDESDPTTTPPPPHKIHEQLTSRGYTRYLPFDRVVLQDPTDDLVASWSEWGSNAELVTADNKDEWSSFLTSYYKMPDMIGEWLRQLVDRPHWFHAMLKKDGKIVMARSLYCQDGWAWLGIDAPVPGWGPNNCCDDDFVVCAKLLEAAAKEGGATSFVSDIEGPNVDKTGPDYDKWTKLGFTIPYKRMVYKWEPPAVAASVDAGEVEVKAT